MSVFFWWSLFKRTGNSLPDAPDLSNKDPGGFTPPGGSRFTNFPAFKLNLRGFCQNSQDINPKLRAKTQSSRLKPAIYLKLKELPRDLIQTTKNWRTRTPPHHNTDLQRFKSRKSRVFDNFKSSNSKRLNQK